MGSMEEEEDRDMGGMTIIRSNGPPADRSHPC